MTRTSNETIAQSETSYTNERGEEVSPEALRQLFRKTGSHEREALLRNLEKDARQTFKVRNECCEFEPTFPDLY